MERTMRILRGTGKVILALLAGILMPVLLWIAFGVAMNQKLRQWSTQRKPAPTIGEILAAAGLSIHGEATTGKAMTSAALAQRTVPEIRDLVTKAGLAIHEEPASEIAGESRPTHAENGKAVQPESTTTI